MATDAPGQGREHATPLLTLAVLFGRLGATAFGGPAAHIALLRHEVVTRRRWIDDRTFLDLVSATHLIPGPNSTELALHLGLRQAGIRGLLVAGVAFTLPAMLLVWVLAIVYARVGTTPDVARVLAGIAPVMLAIIVAAMSPLVRDVAGREAGIAILILSLAAAAAGCHPLTVLALGAAIALAWHRENGPAIRIAGGVVAFAVAAAVFMWPDAAPSAPSQVAASGATIRPTLARIAWFFLKVGGTLFGSGYVLAAWLQADLVDRWGWLTSREMLDALAVGQVTPGPVFTTATFIGYLVGGHAGAIVATSAIFLPGFVLVALTYPLVGRMRESRLLSSVLDGVNAGSLGLLAATVWPLAQAAFTGWPAVAIGAVSLVLLVRLRINPTGLIVGGGAIGWMAH